MAMASDLKPGERIHVKSRKRILRPAIERGMVLSGYRASLAGWTSYYVRLDGEPLGSWTLFLADEIERDGEPSVATVVGDPKRIETEAGSPRIREFVNEQPVEAR
jgi:hypothetical protein